MKLIKFPPFYGVPSLEWLTPESAEIAAALQSDRETHLADREAFRQRVETLTTAPPVERDFVAIQGLCGESVELANREIVLRHQIQDWISQHFLTDRGAESKRASEGLSKVREKVTADLCKIGYAEGGPDTPNSILPLMLMRNSRIREAWAYEQDVHHATAHGPENLSAIQDLEAQVKALTMRVIG